MVDFKLIWKIMRNIRGEDNSTLFLNICFSIIYIGAIIFMCENLPKEAGILEVFYFVTILMLIIEKLFAPCLQGISHYIFYVVERYKKLNKRDKKNSNSIKRKTTKS